jgi:hypothetical protein
LQVARMAAAGLAAAAADHGESLSGIAAVAAAAAVAGPVSCCRSSELGAFASSIS